MNKSAFNPLNVLKRSGALGAIEKITAAVKGRHLTLAAIVALFPTVASATPPSGVTSTVIVRGSFANVTNLKFTVFRGRHPEVAQVFHARETVVQQIVIAPNGHTGWHSHPGPVVVLIKSGQMSFYDSEDPTCTVRTYSAGQSFVDRGQGHVHIARNENPSENLEVWSTYFDVPIGGATRIDAAAPGNCPF